MTDAELWALPPAGASSAAFRPWCAAAPDLALHIVDLASIRGTLSEEPDVAALGHAVARSLPADRPVVLAGHSLGGLVAVEAAACAAAAGGNTPVAVVVMGSRPPTHSVAEMFRPLVELGDGDFLAALHELGALHPMLRDSPLRTLLLPGLRADVELVARSNGTSSVCPVPLHAWHGTDDRIAPPALARHWQAFAAAAFSTTEFAGDHFFPTTAAAAVTAALAPLLAAAGRTNMGASH